MANGSMFRKTKVKKTVNGVAKATSSVYICGIVDLARDVRQQREEHRGRGTRAWGILRMWVMSAARRGREWRGMEGRFGDQSLWLNSLGVSDSLAVV